MGAARKLELDHRLEAYFATLRSSPLQQRLKHRVGNWQIYAAVTGSAMAMVTGASASIIGNGSPEISPDRIGSARTNKQSLGAFTNAVKSAMARHDSGGRFFQGAGGKPIAASQTAAPSIASGGVVPLDGTENIIQPGEWVSIFGNNLASAPATSKGERRCKFIECHA